MTEYRNEEVQLTHGQLITFLMKILPFKDVDPMPETAVVDAALEADFFQLSGKQDAPAFVWPELAGIAVAEVDRRMAKLVEEIVEAVNESMKPPAVNALREEDEAREPKEFIYKAELK